MNSSGRQQQQDAIFYHSQFNNDQLSAERDNYSTFQSPHSDRKKYKSQLPPDHDHPENNYRQDNINNNGYYNNQNQDQQQQQFYSQNDQQQEIFSKNMLNTVNLNVNKSQQMFNSQQIANQKLREFSGENINGKISYLRTMYFFGFFQQFLILTTLYFTYHFQYKYIQYFKDNNHFFYCSIAALFLLSLIGQVLKDRVKNSILNLIFFLIFTACALVFWGYVLVIYDLDLSQMIFLSLTIIFFNQFIYLLFVRILISYQGASLFIFAGQLLLFQIFSLFSDIPLLQMIIVLCISLIFSFYLIYISQKKVEQHKNDFFKDSSSIMNSCLVYTDVIVLFLQKFE